MTVSFLLLVRADPEREPAPVAAHPVRGPADATTLRRTEAGLQLVDGPFAELAEPLIAAGEVTAEGLDGAIRDVLAHPAVRNGVVEIRAMRPADPDDPGSSAEPAPGDRRYLLLHAAPEAGAVPLPTRTLQEWLAEPLVRRSVLAGARLAEPGAGTAATVRFQDGEAVVARGPLPELTAALAGYDLLSAQNLDEAIAVARPHPTLAAGAIEIRPLVWT